MLLSAFSPVLYQHTLPNTLVLTHTHTHTLWQVESFSFLSVRLHPYIFHIQKCSQRNWVNQLQACAITDVLLQHTDLLLFNNQACFELLFPLVPLAQRSVHHAGGEKNWWIAEHLTNILLSPPPFHSRWQARVIRFFFVFQFYSSRKTGNKATWGYLTTASHHNKSKMFKRTQRNYGPFSAWVNFERKARIDSEQPSKLDYEIKYWTYSVWRIEARLKGSKYNGSGYPLRGKTTEKHDRLSYVSQFGDNRVQQGVAELSCCNWMK